MNQVHGLDESRVVVYWRVQHVQDCALANLVISIHLLATGAGLSESTVLG